MLYVICAQKLIDRSHFCTLVYFYSDSRHYSRRLTHFATSDFGEWYLDFLTGTRVEPRENTCIYGRCQEEWRDVSTELSPNLSLSLHFRSALERLAHFLPLRRFVYFLYIRRGFRSATLTLPCQAAVEVFCNPPEKTCPVRKLIFHTGACSIIS